MLLEEEATGARLDAVHHYVRHAGLDVIHGRGPARIGILAAGKTYGDVVTALADLGVTFDDLDALGIRILKPALIWPLEPDDRAVVRRRAHRDRRRRGEARASSRSR